MTTSLSIDSTTNSSLLGSSSSFLASTVQNTDYASSFQLKKGYGSQKLGDSGVSGSNTNQNAHQLQSSSDSAAASAGINAGAGGNNKKKKNIDNNNQQQQSSLGFGGANTPFQLLYPSIFQPAQSSNFFSNGMCAIGQSQFSASQNNAANNTNNRRCGKKKTAQSQNQQQEYRYFFNLRKKDQPASQGKGHLQVYKPKVPPSLTEWFARLSVDERVNCLSTIHYQMTNMFIRMYLKQESSRREYLFAENQQQYDKQQYSYNPYQQQQQYLAQFFQNSYDQSYQFQQESGSLEKRYSSGSNSLEDTFYMRERGEMEMSILCKDEKEKEKIVAEKEILKAIRVLDFNQYLDTLSIAAEFVADVDTFFKVMGDCTGGQAFTQPCSFKFDASTQDNQIDDPCWFKKQSLHSLAGWIVAALEQNLWAHYNYEHNLNMSQAKVNELQQIFKDVGDSDFSEFSNERLAAFLKQLQQGQNLRQLQETLKENAKIIFQNDQQARYSSRQYKDHSPAFSYFSSPFKNTYYHLNDKAYQGGEIDRGGSSFIGGDLYLSGTLEEKLFAQELNDILDRSNLTDKELEFIEYLAQSPLSRANKRLDLICREFLKILKQKYQEDLVENLLKEEAKPKSNKWGHNGGRKKKKKTLQQTQTAGTQNEETHEVVAEDKQQSQSEEQQKQKKKNNKKKQLFSPVNESKKQTDSSSILVNYNSQSHGKKKKKGIQYKQNQLLVTQNENNQSFDDSLKNAKKVGDEIILKGIEMDKSSSLYLEETTTQNSGSLETIKNARNIDESSQLQVLSLSLSKSIDNNSSNSFNFKGNNISISNTAEIKNKNYLQQKAEFSQKKVFTKQKQQEDTAQVPQSEDELDVQQFVIDLINAVCQNIESSQSPVRNIAQSEKQDISQKKESGSSENNRQQRQLGHHAYSVLSAVYEGGEKPQQQQHYFNKKQEGGVRKCSFKKKQDNAQQNVDDQIIRKTSFSKQYSEDFQQNQYKNNNSNNSNNSNNNNSQQQQHNNTKKQRYYQNNKQYQKSSTQDTTQQQQAESKPFRKGTNASNGQSNVFERNLIQNTETSQKTTPVIQNELDQQDKKKSDSQQQEFIHKKKGANQQPSYNQVNNAKPAQDSNKAAGEDIVQKKEIKAQQNMKIKVQEADVQSTVSKDENTGQQNKKKRNRKKPKMNEQDIMNTFMKNLQSNSEDTCTTENESKSEKNIQGQSYQQKTYNNNSSNNTYQSKKYGNNYYNQGNYKNYKNNQDEKVKPYYPEETKNTDNGGYNYKQKNCQNDTQSQQSQQTKFQTSNNNQQSKIQKQQQQYYKPRGQFNGLQRQLKPSSTEDNLQVIKEASDSNSQSKQECVASGKNGTQQVNTFNYIQPVKDDESEQYYDKKAKKHYSAHPQAFKQINFKGKRQSANMHNTEQWETESFSAVTNSSINDSIMVGHSSEMKDTDLNMHSNMQQNVDSFANTPSIFIERKQSMPVTLNNKLTDKNELISKENVDENVQQKQVDLNLVYTYSQNIVPQQNSLGQDIQKTGSLNNLPPVVQSPISSSGLSTQAQCFTPKDISYQSSNQQHMPIYYGQNHYQPQSAYMNQAHQHIPFIPQHQKGGYQSFQGTPVKNNNPQKPHLYKVANPTYQQNQALSSQNEHDQIGQHKGSKTNSVQNNNNNVNFMTPPSLSKKTHNNQNHAQHQKKQHHHKNEQKCGSGCSTGGTNTQKHSPKHSYKNMRFNSQEELYLHASGKLQHHLQPPPPPFFMQQQFQLPFAGMPQFDQYHLQHPIFEYSQNSFPQMLPSQMPFNAYNQFQSQQIQQQQQQYQGFSPTLSHYNSIDQNQNLIQQLFTQLTNQNSLGSGFSQPPSLIGSPPPQIGEYTFQQPSLLDAFLHEQHSQMETNNNNLLFQNGIQLDQNEQIEAEQQFYEKLDQDIQLYTAQIKKNLDKLQIERDFVIQFIQSKASEVFVSQLPKVIMFGSLTTGLALESSDLDVAITDLKIEDRYIMIAEMQKYANALQIWECLASFKFIDTASIPVIKMKVDITKMRLQDMKDLEGLPADFFAKQISEDQRLLSVDITFDDSNSSSQSAQTSPLMTPTLSAQPSLNIAFSSNNITSPLFIGGESNMFGGMNMPCSTSPVPQQQQQQSQHKTHLGLESCYLVQRYIATYPNLKEVAILLKKFLALHGLNSPYYGGISSYSTVLLLVAYMNYFQLRNANNETRTPSQLLMGFLDFYGNYFNPNTFGINVINDGSYFQQQLTPAVLGSLHDSNFVILDPLNLQNNTTRNSYLTSQILKKFQCAFNSLKSLILRILKDNNNKSHSSEYSGSDSGEKTEDCKNNTLQIEHTAQQQLQQQQNQSIRENFNNSEYYTQQQQQCMNFQQQQQQHYYQEASPQPHLADMNAVHHLSPNAHSRSNNNFSMYEQQQQYESVPPPTTTIVVDSITLSDEITNIEGIKRGNFEKVINSLGQNMAIDLGIDQISSAQIQLSPSKQCPLVSSSTISQQEPLVMSNQAIAGSPASKNNNHYSPHSQLASTSQYQQQNFYQQKEHEQLQFELTGAENSSGKAQKQKLFEGVNLLETFFAKEDAQSEKGEDKNGNEENAINEKGSLGEKTDSNHKRAANADMHNSNQLQTKLQ